jgi:fibronectin type 3 domain-containing protein
MIRTLFRARRGLRRPRRRYERPIHRVEALESRVLLSAVGGELLFDFGTSSSPVEAGYTRVTSSDRYDADGYGWLSGTVLSVNRGTGSALARDLNFSNDATFAVDLADGVYDVTVVMGDTVFLHDQMGVFLEDQQFDTISTMGGQIETRTYTVRVSDGQLTLRMQDLGGSDANAVINGLEIRPAAVDETGPRVVGAQALVDDFGYASGVLVTFDEPIQAGTFTAEDIASFSGPGGSVSVAAVHQVDFARFEVLFAEQRMPGEYTLVLGPQIEDFSGNGMDQDGDSTGSETQDDQFTFTFSVAPLVELFDFGTSTQAVEPGFTGVDPDDLYNPDANFGWQTGTVLSVTRTSGTALERDLNFTMDGTFAIDVVPTAVYEVTLHMGDTANFAHDQMGVFLEGVQVDSVTTAPGEVATRTYRVTVHDGQLALRLADLGGNDGNAVINGLEVRFLGFDVTGPRVVSVDTGSVVVGSLDRIHVTFDEAVGDGTFTLADASLVGPNGAVAVTGVNRLSPNEYEVVFDRQFSAGSYTLTIGPDIEDLAGNRMDQDGDGFSGEASEDRFSTSFTLEPFFVAFDFGTATSPVAPNFIGVTPTTTYFPGGGHGWFSGSVLAADRTTGTDVTRDLNFTELATFVADVPIGTYQVQLTMGDAGAFGHDQMGVFLEGVLLDTLSTAPRQVVTRSFEVNVTDGQLTLMLDDLGGTDRNVVINGLELALLSGGPGTAAVTMSWATVATPSSLPAGLARVLDRLPPWAGALRRFAEDLFSAINGRGSSNGRGRGQGGGGSNGRGAGAGNQQSSTFTQTLDSQNVTTTQSSQTTNDSAGSQSPSTSGRGSGSGGSGGLGGPGGSSQSSSPRNTRGSSSQSLSEVVRERLPERVQDRLEALDQAFSSTGLFDQLLTGRRR